jgi:hypothetical protein
MFKHASLRQGNVRGVTNLLARSHSLEALKVIQLSPLRALGSALSKGAVIPLLLHTGIIPLLLQRSMADSTRKFLDFERCKGEMCEGSGVTWDELVGGF